MFQLRARSLILGAAVTVSLAQSPPVPKAFDVATIRPYTANDDHFLLRPARSIGALSATGVTLKFLIAETYNVRAYQVSGGPGWIGQERWDIRAKAEGVEGRLSAEQFYAMVKALLADRFQLKIHSETKEMPVYALLVGKNGSKLIAHNNALPSPEKAGAGRSYIRFTTTAIAKMLSWEVGRPVVDKTGLRGEYDFKLEWAHEQGQDVLEALGLPRSLLRPEAPPPSDSYRPSIFTAVQEQLGLRLESRKGPVEIIMIDHVERPSDN